MNFCSRMSNDVPKMFFFFLFFLVISGNSQAQTLTPALYAFGDSTLDIGNNISNNTKLMNILPYGVDFPGRHSRRLTNGYNMAEFFAQWLGLGLPPPYVLVNGIKKNVTEGINYAISGSMIVEASRGFFGNDSAKPPTLGLQIEQFRRTVEEYLPTRLSSNETLSNHLANSIFMLAIGGNDYLLEYLPNLGSPDDLNPSEFADKVVHQLGIYLKELYDLGARKFVISELGPFGNFLVPPMFGASGLTPSQLNQLALIYNYKLKAKLKELTSSLQDSTFVQLKTFNLAFDLIKNPTKYGVANSKEPCCQVSMFGGCERNTIPCSNRTEYVFFDMLHPTEITFKIIALSCFNGTTGVCIPNIKQLTEIASTVDRENEEEKTLETPPAAKTPVAPPTGQKTGGTPAEEEKFFFIRWFRAFVHKLFGYNP